MCVEGERSGASGLRAAKEQRRGRGEERKSEQGEPSEGEAVTRGEEERRVREREYE